MNRSIPVKTDLGILAGRDCIYLDRIAFRDRTGTLVLEGEINGSLCSKPQKRKWVSYTVTFHGILALKMIELDSWNGRIRSSFDEVKDSKWVRSLGGKVGRRHKHFVVQTYDYVLEVVCSGYETEFGSAQA